MDSNKRLITHITVLAFSLIGALLTTGLDLGGTRWLTFGLYLVFFASFSSLAVFSSRLSCSGMLRRLRK